VSEFQSPRFKDAVSIIHQWTEVMTKTHDNLFTGLGIDPKDLKEPHDCTSLRNPKRTRPPLLESQSSLSHSPGPSQCSTASTPGTSEQNEALSMALLTKMHEQNEKILQGQTKILSKLSEV